MSKHKPEYRAELKENIKHRLIEGKKQTEIRDEFNVGFRIIKEVLKENDLDQYRKHLRIRRNKNRKQKAALKESRVDEFKEKEYFDKIYTRLKNLGFKDAYSYISKLGAQEFKKNVTKQI